MGIKRVYELSYELPPENIETGHFVPVRGELVPYEYAGWRIETDSWKKTAYIGSSLAGAPTYKISGPDVVSFLEGRLVNGFKSFPVGTARHGIMCREDGIIMIDGVLLRTGEEEFVTYWMTPYLQYCLEKDTAEKGYDVKGENITKELFLYQLAGPRSLEILESAAQQSVHDLKFMHHYTVKINDHEVRILRLGMGGSLAYELHGRREDCLDVYNAVCEAGKEYGLVKLGHRAYLMNHTENGFPQAFYHFLYPWEEDEGFNDWLRKNDCTTHNDRVPLGSAGSDIKSRYRNPVDCGWQNAVKFNHDFVGREALEKIIAEDRTRMVTLKWNTDDIIDIYKSQFEQGEPYKPMDYPNDRLFLSRDTINNDIVMNTDGELIGQSSGRCYSYYFREMISLCTLRKEYSEIGTEVIIIWGNEGQRRKKIRATVERFPYLDQGRNEIIGTDHIPEFKRNS